MRMSTKLRYDIAAGVTGKENEEDLHLSSRRDSVNEENTSMNKPEVPKLSMEPQQMKRKKKGGGYNLRKSLAWNRAFFTEEGVLDPSELSLISGNIGKSRGEMLSVIDEDRRESLVGESEDLTALEENLFKEPPASTIKEDRKSAGSSLPKKVASAGVNRNVASTSAVSVLILAWAADVLLLFLTFSCQLKVGSNETNSSHVEHVLLRLSERCFQLKMLTEVDLNAVVVHDLLLHLHILLIKLYNTVGEPANVSTTKAATKELSVSKIPIRKPDPSAHPATIISTIPGVSNLKRNQNVQPAVSVQRNIGPKSSSKNSTSARSNARSGSQPSRSVVVKSSVQQVRRNVASSALEIHSSTNSQHSLITKANDASKINRGPALPASGYSSNNDDGNSNKIATSFPPKAPCSGANMQHLQLQTAKPSGLRMPSPSLGFFNQSKTSSAHSLLQRSNKACNVPKSNIPNLRKFDASNVIHESPVPVPAKIPDIVSGMTTSANLRVSSSVTGSSCPSNLNSGSLEKTKSNLHGNATRKVELNVPSNSNSFDIVNSEQSLHICNDIDQSLKTADRRTNEKISHAVDNELQCSDNRLLLRSAPSDQFMKDEAKERVSNICPMNIELIGSKLENDYITPQLQLAVQVQGVFETKDMIDNKCEEGKMCSASIKDHSASSQSQSGDANGTVLESQSGEANVYSIKGTSKQHDDLLSCAHDVNEEMMKQDEETMPSTLQVDQIKSETQSPSINNNSFSRECRSSELQKCTRTKIANSSPEGKECVAGVDNFCTKSEAQKADVSQSVGMGKAVLGSSALDNMVVDVNETVIDANGSELKSSGAVYSKQLTQHDSGFDMAVEHSHDDTKSGLMDPDFRCDIKPHNQTTSGMSQMLDKYQKSGVVTNGNTKVPNVEHELVEYKQCNLSIKNYRSDSELQPGDDINYCQQNISIVHKNQLNYTHVVNTLSTEGNQIQEAYDELLFEECMPFEKSRESNSSEVVDVCLDAKSCFGREPESPHALCQHEYVKQTNEEVAVVGDTFKHSLVEDAQMLVLDGSLSVDSCNCNFTSSKVKGKSSVDVDDVHFSDPVAAQASLDAHGLCLGGTLIVNNCSSEEPEERNVCGSVMDVVLHQFDACVNEVSSVVCIQAATAVKDDGVDEDPKAEYPSEEGKMSGSVEIEPSVKNLECYTDTKFRHDDDELTWSLTCGVSLNMNEGQNSLTANTCDSHTFCLQNKESMFSVEANQSVSGIENIEVDILKSDTFAEEASISQNNESSTGEMQLELDDKYVTDDVTMSLTGSVFQDVNADSMKIDILPEEVSIVQSDGRAIVEMQHESEVATISLTGSVLPEVNVNSMTSDVSPKEAETIISQKNSSPNNEIHHELDDVIEDKDTTKLLNKSGNDKKQDNLVIKPPPHAIPFSDEWLAAFEAAGEEILTMKRGAVQHSPPDKTQNEPGPWSPVREAKEQSKELGHMTVQNLPTTSLHPVPN
ncbi:hypothetical protein Patl1_30785 [Pistacia atlantica]|uniref:Uncharacterized protein n=1 Tax=Pistacia atlantica TaxID=434234 RepID=A0ACC1ACW2_9ROSI|nr:hypothetical protein Patl1_30785 [Pistacia atlantica]